MNKCLARGDTEDITERARVRRLEPTGCDYPGMIVYVDETECMVIGAGCCSFAI